MAKTLSAALEDIERQQAVLDQDGDRLLCVACGGDAVSVELELQPEVADRRDLAISHRNGKAVGWFHGHAFCRTHRASAGGPVAPREEGG